MRKHVIAPRLSLIFLITSAIALTASTAASATTITGSLNFPAFFGNGFSSTNYYNPNSGLSFLGTQIYGVPPGYGNSNASTSPTDPTAGEPVVVGPGVEFGYADSITTMTADFSEHSLTLQDDVSVDLAKNQQIFVASAPGFFNNIKLVSDNYPAELGGLTYDVAGDTLSVFYSGANATDFSTLPYKADATFTFGSPSAVPEPSAWLLLTFGIGLTGVALRSRRKASLAA